MRLLDVFYMFRRGVCQIRRLIVIPVVMLVFLMLFRFLVLLVLFVRLAIEIVAIGKFVFVFHTPVASDGSA